MKQFSRKHDVIFWYSKSDSWTFNGAQVRVPHVKAIGQGGTSSKWEKASGKKGFEKYSNGKIPETWWSKFSPVGRIKNERLGYPTQKPIALYERIVRASSNEDDVVFDPFCGCATTLVAADRWNRQWVGIDISPVAVRLLEERIKADQGMFQDIKSRTDVPQRTDVGVIPLYNSIENKQQLYGEQGGDCNGCREHFPIRNFTVDHIIARAHGGTDHISNLQLLCGYCNSVKGDRGQEYLLTKLAA